MKFNDFSFRWFFTGYILTLISFDVTMPREIMGSVDTLLWVSGSSAGFGVIVFAMIVGIILGVKE